jgi:hypothetical protein
MGLQTFAPRTHTGSGDPKLAGTAAGIGVFTQNFMGAGVAQIYGVLADRTTFR